MKTENKVETPAPETAQSTTGLPKNNMTTTQTLTKVPTWLPVFSGFYNTIWEPDSNITEQLREDGLEDFQWYDHWDNQGWQNAVANPVARCVALGLIATPKQELEVA